VLLGPAAGLEPRRLRAPDLPRLATFLGLVARPAVFGSAPLGDVAFLGAAAAVANAVARALGTRTRSLPIHPERVLDALEERTA
jgi:CO/xanthine dehydrogenase Mo-binding subunit